LPRIAGIPEPRLLEAAVLLPGWQLDADIYTMHSDRSISNHICSMAIQIFSCRQRTETPASTFLPDQKFRLPQFILVHAATCGSKLYLESRIIEDVLGYITLFKFRKICLLDHSKTSIITQIETKINSNYPTSWLPSASVSRSSNIKPSMS
jgi:hypothetical protein